MQLWVISAVLVSRKTRALQETNETTWTRPTADSASPAPTPTTTSGDLPPGWTAVVDDDTGQTVRKPVLDE